MKKIFLLLLTLQVHVDTVSNHTLSNGYVINPVNCLEAYNNIKTVDDLKLVAHTCIGKNSNDLKILRLIDEAHKHALEILYTEDHWEHDRLYGVLSELSQELGALFMASELHQGVSKRHDIIQKYYDKHKYAVLKAKKKAQRSRGSLINFHTRLYRLIKKRELSEKQGSLAVIINWLDEIGVSSSHDPNDSMAEMKLYDRLGRALYISGK